MRGKAFWGINAIICQGITPAYAGKSTHHLHLWSVAADHPRLCGEKSSSTNSDFITSGSPPPMRGKVSEQNLRDLLGRITPAYAGKREILVHGLLSPEDHPRLCGEKTRWTLSALRQSGSPPPMRGKGGSGFSLTSTYRITPAYAGKSADRQAVIVRQRDHPRLCGEKLILFFHFFFLQRIPPAYAGKRGYDKFTEIGYKDPPRLCGEKRSHPPEFSP